MTPQLPLRPTETSAAARRFQAQLKGRAFLPGEPGYDRARTPWNLAVDQRPAAVAVPTSPAEVVRVVRAAAAADLRIVPQSTGHSAAPLAGRLSDAVLLRLNALTGVSIDAERRIARVTGGTGWQQVIEAAAAHRLAGLHGSGPDIAVAGYALGGGLSWYARGHGLACNQLDAIEIVRADGRLQRVHAGHEPELFWALRGGGGNFGVVTALEMRLLPLREVYAGLLMWDSSRAAEVCRAWANWTHGLPEAVTTSLRLLGNPRRPQAHGMFPGRQVVIVDGAVLADDDRAADLLAPLRALHPTLDTFSRVPARTLSRLHFDPELPSPGVSGHALLDEFDGGTAEAFVDSAGPASGTSLLSAEIRHLGGALGRRDPTGGALDHVPGDYALYAIGGAASPEAASQAAADTASVVAELRAWSSGRRFLNFTDADVAAASAFEPAVLDRLRLVKAEVDPDGRFISNHPID